MTLEEEKLAAKVLPKQMLKRWTYQGQDHLTDQVYSIYPEATHLIIVNNSERDTLGTPKLTTKTLRKRFICQTVSSGQKTVRQVEYENFMVVLCIVEGDTVAVKTIHSQLEG